MTSVNALSLRVTDFVVVVFVADAVLWTGRAFAEVLVNFFGFIKCDYTWLDVAEQWVCLITLV